MATAHAHILQSTADSSDRTFQAYFDCSRSKVFPLFGTWECGAPEKCISSENTYSIKPCCESLTRIKIQLFESMKSLVVVFLASFSKLHVSFRVCQISGVWFYRQMTSCESSCTGNQCLLAICTIKRYRLQLVSTICNKLKRKKKGYAKGHILNVKIGMRQSWRMITIQVISKNEDKGWSKIPFMRYGKSNRLTEQLYNLSTSSPHGWHAREVVGDMEQEVINVSGFSMA